MEKTNAMRILEQFKIPYEALEYPHEEGICVEGTTVAKLIAESPIQVYKTLVTIGSSNHFYVFVIPVEKELDLKKAARSVKEKAVELIPVKELFRVTGYVRGGCSPIGMKKQFSTIFDLTARHLSYIIFSAGKIGYQIKMNPEDLSKVLSFEFLDIIR